MDIILFWFIVSVTLILAFIGLIVIAGPAIAIGITAMIVVIMIILVKKAWD